MKKTFTIIFITLALTSCKTQKIVDPDIAENVTYYRFKVLKRDSTFIYSEPQKVKE